MHLPPAARPPVEHTAQAAHPSWTSPRGSSDPTERSRPAALITAVATGFISMELAEASDSAVTWPRAYRYGIESLVDAFGHQRGATTPIIAHDLTNRHRIWTWTGRESPAIAAARLAAAGGWEPTWSPDGTSGALGR